MEAQTKFKPVVADLPPRTTSGGGTGPAKDVLEAFQVCLENRDKWVMVVDSTIHPNRWYEALRGLGALVSSRNLGVELEVPGKGMRQTYGVWALVPKGDLKPHHKPSYRGQ